MLETTTDVRTRRRDRTREEILEAAWALCREQGLAALSLRDLAARVGMRAPSLYSYFGSKEAIYDAMFAEGQHALLERQAHLDDAPTDRATLLSAAEDFFDFCTSDPVRYQLMFQRVVPGFTPSQRSYALALQVLARLEGALERAGVEDPAMRDLFTALLTGLTDQQISNDPGGDRWRRTLPSAVAMFADHIGLPEPESGPEPEPERA